MIKHPWDLSDREFEAIRLRCELGPLKKVSKKMGLADITVKSYLTSAFRKMGVSCSVTAAAKFTRWQCETERKQA